jgi:hypothetical protein
MYHVFQYQDFSLTSALSQRERESWGKKREPVAALLMNRGGKR